MTVPLIAVDICNTLADVNSQIHKIAGGRKYFDHYGLEDLDYPQPARFFESHPEVFSRASLIPDSLRVMRELAKRFRIAYVSARPSWATERTRAWLALHQLPSGPLFLTKDKTAVVKNLSPLFAIEDSPEEIARISPICPVLVIGQPYNRGCGWSQVLKTVT